MASGAKGKSETYKLIIQAAQKCLQRKGYNHTTMDDIVDESGLSKGTLYWHFESKDDLFTSMFKSLFESMGNEAILPVNEGQTASEKLLTAAHGAAYFSESMGSYFSLFIEFFIASKSREEASHIWYDMLNRYKLFLVDIIEEGISSGEFRVVDAESVAWALLATYDGLAAYTALMPKINLPQISEVFIDALVIGLKQNSDTDS